MAAAKEIIGKNGKTLFTIIGKMVVKGLGGLGKPGYVGKIK